MKRKGIIPEQGYSLEGMTRTKVDRKSQEWGEGRQVEEGKVIPPPPPHRPWEGRGGGGLQPLIIAVANMLQII